jgi:hypothetical protein
VQTLWGLSRKVQRLSPIIAIDSAIVLSIETAYDIPIPTADEADDFKHAHAFKTSARSANSNSQIFLKTFCRTQIYIFRYISFNSVG